jgi:DNA-directed RNA polymerase
MNHVLREAFIRIHSEDVIGRLAAEFSARYKDCMYMAKVRRDSPLWKKVLEWRTTQDFSRSKRTAKTKITNTPRLEELLLERERVMLLRSSDPQDVEKGKKMVTPASIFEEMSAQDDLAPEEDLGDLALGDVSTQKARLQADKEIEVGDASDIESNTEEVDNPLPDGARLDAALGEDVDEVLATDGQESSESLPNHRDIFEKETGYTKREGEIGSSFIWLPLTFPPVPKKVC